MNNDQARQATNQTHASPQEMISEKVEAAVRYFRETEPQSILTDLDRAIRTHPYRALAVGFGVGWLLGKLARR
jgi:ElaB/YqjD/DUF883 family membrane-anchored ribosome-binding protein